MANGKWDTDSLKILPPKTDFAFTFFSVSPWLRGEIKLEFPNRPRFRDR